MDDAALLVGPRIGRMSFEFALRILSESTAGRPRTAGLLESRALATRNLEITKAQPIALLEVRQAAPLHGWLNVQGLDMP